MKSSVKALFTNLDPKRDPTEENPRILLGIDPDGEVRDVYLCTSRCGGVVLQSGNYRVGTVFADNEGAPWVNMTGPRGQSPITHRFLEPGEKIEMEFVGD